MPVGFLLVCGVLDALFPSVLPIGVACPTAVPVCAIMISAKEENSASAGAVSAGMGVVAHFGWSWRSSDALI